MTNIDVAELTVRIAESCMGNRRPEGMSAADALSQLRKLDPETVRGFERAALAAANYIAECCNAENPGSVEVKAVFVESEQIQ